MATYIISYDLVKKRDYEELYKAIKSLGKWARVVESTWLVVCEKSCIEVRDSLLEHMDGDDKLFVSQSSGVGAWRNVRCSNEWLKTNL
ncbi:CRISPR-associated protein Cas2 [Pectobacterium brasiliense]|uniref:hypothetical protein n=1 Tax=Pectobacterium brasiliense TaxID=180957 RepID=UPI00196907BE|nr:hypothetical protein [Pectobacterium brasiliense]MBN3074473.1 CRISPR-associated protein Cas2 [Pectobacterium brasiliense]MBN3170502.1 CRISPR-associated protein Cas2 [Pectobacterium brasiliense]